MRPIEDWGRGGWPAIGTGAAGGIRAMIEVKGLSFTYTGAENPAVNDLEFAVEDGEIFGFLGPNGADGARICTNRSGLALSCRFISVA